MRYKAFSSSFHGRKLLGVFDDLSAAFEASACTHPGRETCKCGGGFLIALLDTDADRALVLETMDGQSYCYIPTDVGVSFPLLYETVEPATGEAS
jgi:hypothetical protein